MTDKALRASCKNYIWRVTDSLGTGAFGNVYKGYHKVTGEVVAIKALNPKLLSSNHIKQHLQELEILKTLDHPNIIKLVTVDEELSPKSGRSSTGNLVNQVIIMEYANQGSIYNLLECSDNAFGLSDAETLSIIAHISAGLRYLRDNHQVIHRDVKPSNILKTISSDGFVLYKLCDFGAARVLAENESFQSFVGTPEYLHPNIYDRALLGGGESRFPATCDLWSVGVTIYQVATGQLPFRPLGGVRANRRVMMEMTVKKTEGVISGVQKEDGKIQWSKTLPANSRLSSGLRPPVTRLVAALLDNSASARYSFDEFFRDADRVSSLSAVHCLRVRTAQFMACYETSSYAELLNELRRQCSTEADLRLFWDGRLLDSESADIEKLRSQSSASSPVFVVEPACSQLEFPVPNLPLRPSMPESQELEGDLEWMKGCAAVSHWIRRQVQDFVHVTVAIDTFLRSLWQFENEKVKELEINLNLLKKTLLEPVGRQMDILNSCGSLSEEVAQYLRKKRESAEPVQSGMVQLERHVQDVKGNLDQSPPPALKKTESCPDLLQLDLCCQELTELVQQFRKDKAMRIGPQHAANETHWHDLMKKRGKILWETSLRCLNGVALATVRRELQRLEKELQSLMSCLDVLCQVSSQIGDLEGMARAFSSAFHQVLTTHLGVDHQQSLTGSNKSRAAPPSGVPSRTDNKLLEVLAATQELRDLSSNNNQLFEKFLSFTLASDTSTGPSL